MINLTSEIIILLSSIDKHNRKIPNALDDGKYVGGVFFDFEREFDTVNHKILLSKLEHYGIRGMPFKLFQNYLTNRTQFVEINKKSSNVLPINYGVSQ